MLLTRPEMGLGHPLLQVVQSTGSLATHHPPQFPSGNAAVEAWDVVGGWLSPDSILVSFSGISNETKMLFASSGLKLSSKGADLCSVFKTAEQQETKMPPLRLTRGQRPTSGNDRFVPSQEDLDFESWHLEFLSQEQSSPLNNRKETAKG